MNILNLIQGSDEWHAWRATRRMASESPSLLGLSPWNPKTPLQLYEVKSGLTVIEQTPAMLHGLAHEARAREIYERENERRMPPCVVEDDDGYAASLDGFSEGRVLEIKCPPKGSDSDLWNAADIPEHYRAQVQHQLMVTGAPACDFLVYAANIDKYKLIKILPDPGRQLSIRFAWDAFWPRYASNTPPEPIEGDFVERFDAEWLDLEARYVAAKSAEEEAAAVAEKLRGDLLALAGDSCCRGERLRVTRYWARGNVDYGKVPALKGVDLDAYRKKGNWRFRIGNGNGNGR